MGTACDNLSGNRLTEFYCVKHRALGIIRYTLAIFVYFCLLLGDSWFISAESRSQEFTTVNKTRIHECVCVCNGSWWVWQSRGKYAKRADRDAGLIHQHSRLEFQKEDTVHTLSLCLFPQTAFAFLPPSLQFLHLHSSLISAHHNSSWNLQFNHARDTSLENQQDISTYRV